MSGLNFNGFRNPAYDARVNFAPILGRILVKKPVIQLLFYISARRLYKLSLNRRPAVFGHFVGFAPPDFGLGHFRLCVTRFPKIGRGDAESCYSHIFGFKQARGFFLILSHFGQFNYSFGPFR